MTVQLIIFFCVLLLFAYVFDISAAKTKIPSVVLLLLLGWGVRQGSRLLGITVPNLMPLLPLLGTIGLILIVLEGSLDLNLDRSKLPLVGKSFLMALLPILFIGGLLGLGIFAMDEGLSYQVALANALPFAVISSAIAIPSSRMLGAKNREFITYESSLSDIIGVITFNFLVFNTVIDSKAVLHSLQGFLITLLVTVVATAGLIFLLSKISHHVKFVPIILLLVLIYALAELWHWPALLFIILFGLVLANVSILGRVKFLRRWHPDVLVAETGRFRELVFELSFLVRASFFLLFGFLLETQELLDFYNLPWAVLITAFVFLIRFLLLRLFRLPASDLWFLAPRGLTTILLFMSIPLSQASSIVSKSIVVQVVILSSLVMMAGSVLHRRSKPVAAPAAEGPAEKGLAAGTPAAEAPEVADAPSAAEGLAAETPPEVEVPAEMPAAEAPSAAETPSEVELPAEEMPAAGTPEAAAVPQEEVPADAPQEAAAAEAPQEEAAAEAPQKEIPSV